MDCEFFDVLMVVRMVTRLVEVLGYLSLNIQMDGHPSHWRTVVVYYLNVERREIQGKRQVSHAVESVERQTHRSREMNQAQSGKRAGEATVWDSHSDGHFHANDALGRDIDRGLDFGSVLDLCACPYHDHEDRDLGRRSTALLAPDSYGTQP